MTSRLRWHRGNGYGEDLPSEPGDWYAEAGGKVIARVSVRTGTATGYWGRYEYHITGSGLGRQYAVTLTEIKNHVRRYHSQEKNP
jgi:DMSO/TMAO reductase YedYZ molybdopterin-dependent catalytic subunit